MKSGLEIQGISRRFGSNQVLRNVSLVAPPGRITALIGQNGVGKTTLFRILMGLMTPDSGSATLGGRSILGMPIQKKAEAGLGYLPQECASFPELTVKENLLALLELFPLEPARRKERLGELLAMTGIEEISDRPFRLLSAGEQRRLEIAKAFVSKPEILLLDEPFSGLDPCMVEDLAGIFRGFVSEGVGVLVTDHNVHSILRIAGYAYLLAGGSIVCEGTPPEVLGNSEARRLYFGREFSAQ